VGAVEVVVGDVRERPALRQGNEEEAAGETELLAPGRGRFPGFHEAGTQETEGGPVGGGEAHNLEVDLRVWVEGPRGEVRRQRSCEQDRSYR